MVFHGHAVGKHQVKDVLDAISLRQKLAKLWVPSRQLPHRSGESVAVSVVNPYVKIGHGQGASLVDAGEACACGHMLRARYLKLRATTHGHRDTTDQQARTRL